MLTWTKILELPEYGWFSPELAAERNEIEAELESLADQRAGLMNRSAEVAATDVADLDYSAVKAAEKGREQAFKLLKAELHLREKRLTPFHKRLAEESRKLKGKLVEELPVLEAEISTALEKLGYNRPIPGVPTAGSWGREMLLRHPRHIALRDQIDELSTVPKNGHASQNVQSIIDVREHLEAYRRIAAV